MSQFHRGCSQQKKVINSLQPESEDNRKEEEKEKKDAGTLTKPATVQKAIFNENP
jgi:hypothetical protein